MDMFEKVFNHAIYGQEKYKGVLVFWDEDEDKRVFTYIDQLTKEQRRALIAIQEHEGSVTLILNGKKSDSYPHNEWDNVEVGGDVWFVDKIHIFGNKWKSYKKYLQSDEWQEIKDEYGRHRQTSLCSVCGDYLSRYSINFHHWTYPRYLELDTYRNLILVCQSCHGRIHKCMNHNSKDITFNEYKTDLYLNGIIKSRDSLFF